MTHEEAMKHARAAHFDMMVAGRAMDLWGKSTKVSEVQEFCFRIASAVAQAEREACAQIVERNAAVCGNNAMLRDVLMGNAEAIRARGES